MASLVEKYKNLISNFEKGQMVGLDIGLSAVKVALLSRSKKNKYALLNYGSVQLSEAAIIEDDIQKPDEVIDAISKAIKNAKIIKKQTCLGIAGPNTMAKRLSVPEGAKDEVRDNIEWESEQYMPFNADDAEIGFEIIESGDSDNVDAIVGAGRVDILEKYIEYAEEAERTVKVVDLNIFALSNIFELIYEDNIKEINARGAIIIDLGAQTTKILVYKNGGPILTKEINIGGVLVTEDIQRSLGVSYFEAEDLKIHGDEEGNLPEAIVVIIELHIQKLLDELKKVLNFYIATGSSEQVGYCFVSGGSARLPSITSAISELVGLETEEINPFDVIDIKGDFSDEELDSIATNGLVALGLSMRCNS